MAEDSASGGRPPARPEAAEPRPTTTGLLSWLPGWWTFRHYRREWLSGDVVAGLVLSSMLVPAGMGYAEAAGLPAVTGLYATIAPLLAYAVFGPSRIMVLGPDSALAAMIAAAVVHRAGGDPERAVALASALGLLTGLVCVAAGLGRVGFLSELLSRPVRVGAMNGIALTVMVTQLPKLCGFTVSSPDVLRAALEGARALWAGRAHPVVLGLGASALVQILVLRAVAPRVPGVLLAVVGTTVAVAAFGLSGAVPVVGPVPQGFPVPALPRIAYDDLAPLLSAAVGIALLAFADTSVLSRAFAARRRERVDANRELVALGLANLAGGFFQGFPVSSSASRTPVAESAGARTQLTGVVGALVIVLLLLLAPGLLRPLPIAALAAVVIAAAVRLVELRELGVFFRVRPSDFWLSLVAFLAVVTLGVLPGVGVAVLLSLLEFFRRAWRPHDAVLGRDERVKGYHDVTRYPGARQIPGLLLFRWDAPLFFANAQIFRERLEEELRAAPAPVRWVVLAAEPITDVDTTAAETLAELHHALTEAGVQLVFAELKDPVKDCLRRYGLLEAVGPAHFHATLGVAVRAYHDAHPDVPRLE